MRCIAIIGCFLLFMSCENSGSKNTATISSPEEITNQEIYLGSVNGAYLSMDKKRYDFGKISRKKVPNIPVEFTVENKGKTPLVIIKADVSCGCLSVEYPKEPIKPGETASLTVNVDTKAQEGVFNKTVFIKSNAENDVELIRIVGEVKK